MKYFLSTFINFSLRPKQLSEDEGSILIALLQGWMLKSHRSLNGEKIYQLHALSGKSQRVNKHSVSRLQKRGYIASNQKFPAATYILTKTGQAYASKFVNVDAYPIIATVADKQ